MSVYKKSSNLMIPFDSCINIWALSSNFSRKASATCNDFPFSAITATSTVLQRVVLCRTFLKEQQLLHFESKKSSIRIWSWILTSANLILNIEPYEYYNPKT